MDTSIFRRCSGSPSFLFVNHLKMYFRQTENRMRARQFSAPFQVSENYGSDGKAFSVWHAEFLFYTNIYFIIGHAEKVNWFFCFVFLFQPESNHTSSTQTFDIGLTVGRGPYWTMSAVVITVWNSPTKYKYHQDHSLTNATSEECVIDVLALVRIFTQQKYIS